MEKIIIIKKITPVTSIEWSGLNKGKIIYSFNEEEKEYCFPYETVEAEEIKEYLIKNIYIDLIKENYRIFTFQELGLSNPIFQQPYEEDQEVTYISEFFEGINYWDAYFPNQYKIIRELITIMKKEITLKIDGFTPDKVEFCYTNDEYMEKYNILFDGEIVGNTYQEPKKEISKPSIGAGIGDIITPTTGPFKGLEFKVVEILEDGVKAVMVDEKDPVPMIIKNYEVI